MSGINTSPSGEGFTIQNTNMEERGMITEQLYVNEATGSVDVYDGWWYTDEDGELVNAVDMGEVVEIEGEQEAETELGERLAASAAWRA